jgi:solute carrier family 9 (sodium/hydrogen exchanger), member 6/7
MGIVNSLLTKFTYIKQHQSLETVLFILISYSAFLAAEAAEFTGIVAVLFCGVFQAHYTYNNLSEESKIETRQVFHLLNFLSENFIFIYIGITMFTFRNHDWQFGFISASFFAILLGRCLNIYPLAFLINLTRPAHRKIDFKSQNLMTFSGLRGAVAFALSIRNTSTNSRQLILTTTSTIVIVTVVFCGGLTRKMIEWLKIE